MPGYQSGRISFSDAKSVLVKFPHMPQSQFLNQSVPLQSSLLTIHTRPALCILWASLRCTTSVLPVLHGSHVTAPKLPLPHLCLKTLNAFWLQDLKIQNGACRGGFLYLTCPYLSVTLCQPRASFSMSVLQTSYLASSRQEIFTCQAVCYVLCVEMWIQSPYPAIVEPARQWLTKPSTRQTWKEIGHKFHKEICQGLPGGHPQHCCGESLNF